MYIYTLIEVIYMQFSYNKTICLEILRCVELLPRGCGSSACINIYSVPDWYTDSSSNEFKTVILARLVDDSSAYKYSRTVSKRLARHNIHIPVVVLQCEGVVIELKSSDNNNIFWCKTISKYSLREFSENKISWSWCYIKLSMHRGL